MSAGRGKEIRDIRTKWKCRQTVVKNRESNWSPVRELIVFGPEKYAPCHRQCFIRRTHLTIFYNIMKNKHRFGSYSFSCSLITNGNLT